MSDRVRGGESRPPIGETGWYLETLGEGGTLRRVQIRSLPFRVGRRHGLELVLPADSVSKEHAEIYSLGPGLRLRDLDSKNGTFLNRALVEDAALGDGDILHFADFEFRLCRSDVEDQTPAAAPDERPTTVAMKKSARQLGPWPWRVHGRRAQSRKPAAAPVAPSGKLSAHCLSLIHI